LVDRADEPSEAGTVPTDLGAFQVRVPGKGRAGMKVLIADDSKMVRERLVALVSELEVVDLVGQAGEAGETLAQMRQLKPDVVVLEPRMTRGLGIQVLEWIRTLSMIPMIITLTAFPYAQDRRRCLALGADYYLDKTTEFERVAEVVRELGAQTPISRAGNVLEPATWVDS
jgi:DNA-binding NarL/FixJ family response regulator